MRAQGNVQAAVEAAQILLQQCQQEGTKAYIGADYDFAMANWLLGKVLKLGGVTTEALTYLQTAQQIFEVLGGGAINMASASLAEQGDCLTDLGQLNQAVVIYQEAIKLSEKSGDIQGAAAKKGQLASVYIFQKDYTAALQGHREALALFQQLNEPGMVATAYHQIGMVYRLQVQFKQAETAYRKSLSIKTQQGNPTDEASSLNELANLYNDWNRPEQAVDYCRQAADIYSKIGDLRYEGIARSNLASTLIKLDRLNEARPELLRAIECLKPFGYTAQPWKALDVLYGLELSDNNPQAAKQARQKAINAFLAYRREGGENHEGVGRLALMVLQAIQQGDTAEIEQIIEQLLEQEDWQEDKAYLHQLQAIIAGDRTALFGSGESCHAPTEYDDMSYQKVVELKLLLEQLAA